MTIKDMEIGSSARITKVGGEGELRQHFLDMGVIPGTEITLMKYAPMGDPLQLKIHGYELTLRVADAARIEVESIEKLSGEEGETEKLNCEYGRDGRYSVLSQSCKDCKDCMACKSGKAGKSGKDDKSGKGGKASYQGASKHPGLGEGGSYHDKTHENPVPKGTVLTFALAGNQNCGKTTLFNQLTGSNQHVGNFPGVTVDGKSGLIRGNADTLVTDLPGIYSLSPYTAEEIVSRNFILNEKPRGIINIVDANNIERNLYLTLQLMELDIPIVLALNMMDEVRGNGGVIHINEMEEALGIPVVPISAAKNEGVDELVKHALHIAKYQEKPAVTDFCGKDSNGGAVHRCLHGIMQLVEDHAENAGIPLRFAASKLIEGDKLISEALKLTQNEEEMIEHIIVQMEEERGMDRAAAIADMRFAFIKKVCRDTVIKPHESKEHKRSRHIDEILTGKFTAIPSFIGIMALVFYLTFNVIGAWLQGLCEDFVHWVTALTDAALVSVNIKGVLHDLIIDGAFAGVGSVISFLPVIVVLFFFLSILEDSGYMARVAFVMDKLLRKIGLSGRSIVPMLIGFGCSVPAIMASRTLPSARDRKMTIMMTPFMSCTAKLPVYGYFCQVFFPEHSGLIMVGLYFLGIIVGIIAALVSKSTLFKGEAVPFVMELPNYRLPGAKNVAMLLWDKAKDFLQRAFTILFVASIVVWFLQTFDFTLNAVADSQDSMLAVISGFVSPIFSLQGFGDWRIVTSLVAGFIAKESVVSTLTVLFGAGGIAAVLTKQAAASLLIFCLLYTPCIAAIASVKRELSWKWAVAMVALQCAIAWVVSLIAALIL